MDQQQFIQFCEQASISNTGRHWQKKVQVFLFRQMHTLWKSHTASVHKPTHTTSATHARLATQIEHLQHLHQQAGPRDTSFHLSSNDLDRAKTSQLQNWLNMYQDFIHLDIKVRNKAARHRQHLITHFFGTGPGPPP